MRILVTGAGGKLGQALVKALSKDHDVVTTDLPSGKGRAKVTHEGDPRDRDFAAECVTGCDAIIYDVQSPISSDSDIDRLDGATRGVYNLLTTSKASRFILLSSLRIFEQYPVEYWVTEQWAPRPTTDVEDLANYLAELTVLELSRAQPVKGIALRLGTIVDDEDLRRRPADPRWLHIDDAVQAVERALAFEPGENASPTGWWVFHIPGGGRRSRFALARAGRAEFGYAPRRDVTSAASLPIEPIKRPEKPRFTGRVGGAARRVVIYGAGGPLGSATTEVLKHDHLLRLADIRAIADIIAENKPQRPGSPLPRLLDIPHEMRVVDVTDPEQTLKAAQGMEAIVNCTVLRPHPVEAFRVNMLGAYNIMKAAVACGIRRVVHTGPRETFVDDPVNYWYDFNISEEVPVRPANSLYFVTKFLGQEICRIFAEEYDLEVPALLFGLPTQPGATTSDDWNYRDFYYKVSWQDGALAIRQALHAPGFPKPYDVFHIMTDVPHGKYRNEKAKRLLNWQPRDFFEDHWIRKME